MQRTHKGFTLVEMMVTIVIVAVLSALAFPSMRSLIVRNRVRDAATDIFLVLHETRSEALKRNTNVTVRPVSGTDWTSGWHILDPVNSGADLEVHQPLQVGDPAHPLAVTGPNTITYQSTGRLAVTSAPSFVVSGSYSSHTSTATIKVDPSGRPYITETL
jgi:type IV fimbrial biogenesis protein FimT